MPIRPRQIRSDLIIILRILQNPHIQVYDRHALRMAPKPRDGARIGNADLRKPCIAFSWRATSVGEDDAFGKSVNDIFFFSSRDLGLTNHKYSQNISP